MATQLNTFILTYLGEIRMPSSFFLCRMQEDNCYVLFLPLQLLTALLEQHPSYSLVVKLETKKH